MCRGIAYSCWRWPSQIDADDEFATRRKLLMDVGAPLLLLLFNCQPGFDIKSAFIEVCWDNKRRRPPTLQRPEYTIYFFRSQHPTEELLCCDGSGAFSNRSFHDFLFLSFFFTIGKCPYCIVTVGKVAGLYAKKERKTHSWKRKKPLKSCKPVITDKECSSSSSYSFLFTLQESSNIWRIRRGRKKSGSTNMSSSSIAS